MSTSNNKYRLLNGTTFGAFISRSRQAIRTILKSMVLTSTLLYLTTCCRSDSPYLRTIDPDLAPYIIEFKAEMEQRGALPTWAPLPMSITYGKTPPGVAGLCYLPANVVILDDYLRDTDIECERKITIFHELTHCVGLISKHSTDPRSIMYYKQTPCTEENWGKQLDQLARFIKRYSPIYRLKVQVETPVDADY